MRTPNEIVEKINSITDLEDFFGFSKSDLLGFLDYVHAKPFLKEETTEEQWNEVWIEPMRKNVVAKMRDYLGFAIEKAENRRGLSAIRSMSHYYAWIWLIDEERYFGNVLESSGYGLDTLDKIKEWLKEQ